MAAIAALLQLPAHVHRAIFSSRRLALGSVLVACVAVDVVLAMYLAWCPWFLADFDYFHGDIVAGALLIDQLGPMASDPYTTLALPIYAAVTAGALITLRMATNAHASSDRRV